MASASASPEPKEPKEAIAGEPSDTSTPPIVSNNKNSGRIPPTIIRTFVFSGEKIKKAASPSPKPKEAIVGESSKTSTPPIVSNNDNNTDQILPPIKRTPCNIGSWNKKKAASQEEGRKKQTASASPKPKEAIAGEPSDTSTPPIVSNDNSGSKNIRKHLRPRDSVKKPNLFLDEPQEKKSNAAKSMADEEDEELSANISASHFLGGKGSTKRLLRADVITVHNTPKKPRRVTSSSVVNHQQDGNNSGNEAGIYAENGTEELQDVYCWECHKECVEGALDCASCPRTYHPACIPSQLAGECSTEPSENWICPACLTIMKAECAETRSWAMQQLNIDQLAAVLGFVLQRIKHSDVKTSEAFQNPVPRSLLPDYYEIVFHPMDLSTIDKNIKNKLYASTEAFLEDTKWLTHNTMVYHGLNSKHTTDAKVLVRICRQELMEVELCPECYLNSCIKKDDWFTEPCNAPHALVWAKLKGFPYWPAKALRVTPQKTVDIRFFGAHDRSLIPINQICLLSEECPIPIKNVKKYNLDKALGELQLHIRRIREKFGEFHYAPPKTDFKPEHLSFCTILYGTRLLNTDLAKKMMHSSVGKRYRDMVSGGDIGVGGAGVGFGGDDQSSYGGTDAGDRNLDDDGQSSDTESRTNESASATPQRKVIPGPDEANNMEEQDEVIETNGGDATAESKKDDDVQPPRPLIAAEGATKLVSTPASGIEGATTQEPPIRIRLNVPGLNKLKFSLTKNAARLVTQSPDSTSVTAATNGVDQSKRSNTPSPLAAIATTVTTESGKRPAPDGDGGSKTTPAKDDGEPPAKKRTLQSVVENLHSNQQTNAQSVSPASNDTSSAVAAASASASSAAASSTAASVAPKHPNHLLNRPPEKRTTIAKTSATTSTSATSSASASSAAAFDSAGIFDKYQEKISDYVQSTISELKREVEMRASFAPGFEGSRDQQAYTQLQQLKGELGRMQTFYNEAIRAMKHTAKTTFMEVQQAMESEKAKLIDDMKRKFEDEKKQAVAEAKSKQWCANCGKQAVFYCCWNTSYCDYPCQQQHWPKHQASCAQIRAPEAAPTHQVTNNNQLIHGAHQVHYVGGPGGARLNTSTSGLGNSGGVLYASSLPQGASLIRTNQLQGGANHHQGMSGFAGQGGQLVVRKR